MRDRRSGKMKRAMFREAVSGVPARRRVSWRAGPRRELSRSAMTKPARVGGTPASAATRSISRRGVRASKRRKVCRGATSCAASRGTDAKGGSPTLSAKECRSEHDSTCCASRPRLTWPYPVWIRQPSTWHRCCFRCAPCTFLPRQCFCSSSRLQLAAPRAFRVKEAVRPAGPVAAEAGPGREVRPRASAIAPTWTRPVRSRAGRPRAEQIRSAREERFPSAPSWAEPRAPARSPLIVRSRRKTRASTMSAGAFHRIATRASVSLRT